MALGEPERALEWWQVLRQTLPNVPYYAIEEATANYQLCRPSDAITILEEQIEAARPRRLMSCWRRYIRRWVNMNWPPKRQRRDWKPPHPRLVSLSCGKRRGGGSDYNRPLASAQALLQKDPGHGQGNLLTARHLQSLEIKSSPLSIRTSSHVPRFLCGAGSSQKYCLFGASVSKALSYAETLIENRPWDVESQLRYAIALPEDEQVRKSLDELRLINKRTRPADVVRFCCIVRFPNAPIRDDSRSS